MGRIIFALKVSATVKIRENKFIKEYIDLFIEKRATVAASSLAYYLIFTVFPLLICLYSMLGSRYTDASNLLNIVKNLLSEQTYKTIHNFLSYVSRNQSITMLIAALVILVTSASSAFRAFQLTVGDIQGEVRYRGFGGIVKSIVLSLLFLAFVYVAIMVLLTGNFFIELIDKKLGFIDMNPSFKYIRSLALIIIVYLFVYFLIRLALPVEKEKKYSIALGSAVATLIIIVISLLFSLFISTFSRYPLVYGALASLILLLFWLWLCSIGLYMGVIFNVVLRDYMNQKKMMKQVSEYVISNDPEEDYVVDNLDDEVESSDYIEY